MRSHEQIDELSRIGELYVQVLVLPQGELGS